jgi:hypothetical protein
MANGMAEACWLRQLLVELHNPLSRATLVYCDNINAVYLSTNPIQHQCTKHVEIDYLIFTLSASTLPSGAVRERYSKDNQPVTKCNKKLCLCFGKHLKMWFVRGIPRATLKLHCPEKARKRKQLICMLLILFMRLAYH